MPPSPIMNLDELDCGRVVHSRERIYEVLPQRHEFAQLDGIIHLDTVSGLIAGYRDVRADEWWCRGHLPGNPIFPGILMVECVAQLAGFAAHFIKPEIEGFVAFGGIDRAKFRESVIPPTRLLFVGRALEVRKRRVVCDTQAFVEGKMAFEGVITGLWMR